MVGGFHEFGDVEVDGTVGFVGEAVVYDFLDEIDVFLDVFGYSYYDVGVVYTEGLHVGPEIVFPFSGEFGEFFSFFVGSKDDFVVDVGDVHTEHEVVVEIFGKDSSDHIDGNVGSGVTHVRSIVYLSNIILIYYY